MFIGFDDLMGKRVCRPFDKKVFNLYRYEFKTHPRAMSKKTKLSESTIYRTVKRCKIKINEKLKDQYYEK